MNKTIKLEDGTTVELQGDPKRSVKDKGALLGKGGQGAVYKVKNLQTGKILALKIYLHPMSSAFIDNLRKNIIKGAPNDSFLWPLGLTEPLGTSKDKYGYIMELYDNKKYASFVKLIKGKVAFPSKETQIETLIELVDAFEELHAQGYSYQDLNDGGVLLDCQNGRVLVCDNDNVSPYGVNLGIIGKFKYMAPEVAIKMFKPDKHSDRFSLAVLMFLLLLHAHPFDGIKRLSGQLTPALQEKIYGTEPVFIFHPTDKSNCPDPQIDANALKAWPLLPDFIQDLFIKTFTSGMPSIGKKRDELERERQDRVSEKDWREALHRWMDTMANCPKCNHSVCVNVQNNQIQETICPHCGKQVKIVLPILLIKKNGKLVRTIILEDGKQVAKRSVTNEHSNEPAFTVKRSKKVADAYGIENLLSYQWKCSQSGAKDRLVNTHEVVGAFNGVHIEFDYVYSGDIIYTRY